MHRRQLNLAPHHQRISPVDIHRPSFKLLSLVAAPAPTCAFHANGTPGWTVSVARDFAITFVTSGLSLSFAKGTGVVLDHTEAWRGNDKIAIVIDKVWTTPDYRLVALRDVDVDNNLRSFIVGGFDLDPTGAILAGSFWDANLESGTIDAGADPVATRMAKVFVTRARDGFTDTTGLDLTREGFSEREVMQHYEAAATIAAAQLQDTDLSADRVAYDRQQRVMLGANAVAGIFLKDPGSVHTACRLAGLSTHELGNLFDDIIGESMRLVREARSTLLRVQ